ncbi:molybdenum cofactor biosynthesis protein MoaE [Qingshengfaniella alkalisoli]|uniref:Molybdopterin synthase catalytic subunit n=1 Tax=Qingshengfaniella alkalisoli TaxID=2599296 RepID=A0A5B8IVP4_9RHOB|nr:molybdenum cofactor biosynthesis protein MoaE [Qingshengfaniella alkalisoli]QDY69694.1 molybdenum cofactor biosynthesis protein MoaE [Qingshengfaniella alkalisoli]
MSVRVQSEAFDAGAELNVFTLAQSGAGAVVSFSGIVRNNATGDLVAMEIEHYPAMTEQALETCRAEAVDRWLLTGALIIHRYGRLVPGDTIMMVATAAPHRADAFAASEFLMDYLKSRAPFWKKEHSGSGEAWVDARGEDEDALARWDEPKL